MVEVANLLEDDLGLSGLNLESQESFIRSLFSEDPAARTLGDLALKYNVNPEEADNPVDLVHGLLSGLPSDGHLE
jgi:hypothetical protein